MKDKGTTYKKGTTKLRITHLPEIKRVCLVLEKDRQQELLAYFKTEEKAKKFIETIDYFMEDKLHGQRQKVEGVSVLWGQGSSYEIGIPTLGSLY